MLPDKNNVLNLCPEPPVDYVFNNFNRKCFKFIQMDDNVYIPNFQFNQNFLLMVQNHIANYLTLLGFACELQNTSSLFNIVIPVEFGRNEIIKFLQSLDWSEVLKPFANVFRKVVVQYKSTDNGKYIIKKRYVDIDNNTNSNYDNYNDNDKRCNLYITIMTESVDNIIIELTTNQDFFALFINELDDKINDYNVLNGWDFIPQLQPFYTKLEYCKNPVTDFKIYGKKQIFKIHDKYLPLMWLNLIRINGFKINNTEYWFDTPKYVSNNFNIYGPNINAYRVSKLFQPSNT